MWLSDEWKDYEVIDTSSGEKLERWGKYILVRPDPQVIWTTPKQHPLWRKYDAKYSRSNTGGGKWSNLRLPEQWQVHYKELTFNVKPMNFKHTGLFPEQAVNWDFAREKIEQADRPIRVLNLFAYTGAASVACAKSGASVCHVDAAKGMVAWAKENAKVSGLADAPIRWIVDDCAKFVEREIRRGKTYDAIIMDPPSYGRGPGGEVWKLEDNLFPFVKLCSQVLSDKVRHLFRRCGPFLQKDDVAGHFRTGIFKRIIRQADSAQKVGSLCQVFPDGGVRLIQCAF